MTTPQTNLTRVEKEVRNWSRILLTLSACIASLSLAAFLAYCASVVRHVDGVTLPKFDEAQDKLARSADESIKGAPELVRKADLFLTSGQQLVDELRGPGPKSLASAARNIDAAAAGIAGAANKLPLLTDTVQGAVEHDQENVLSTLQHVDNITLQVERVSEHSEKFLSDELPALAKTIGDLERSSASFAVVADETAQAHIAQALGDTARETAGTAAEVHRSASYLTEKLIGKPYQPTGNRLVRGLKQAGHFTLQVVKASPALTLGIIRWISAS